MVSIELRVDWEEMELIDERRERSRDLSLFASWVRASALFTGLVLLVGDVDAGGLYIATPG